MNDNRLTIHLLPIALTFGLIFILPFPSVRAQKIIKIPHEPKMVFRIGVGSQHLFGQGPTGGHFSINCEAPVSKHMSWTANFDVLMNPLELVLPPDIPLGSYQIRFAIQPDFRYYPNTVLRGLYIGSGLGIVAGQGRTYGILSNGKPQLNIFAEALTDLKIGWQGNLFDRYIWNTFVASGLLIPLNSEKMIPFVRLGLQIGLKRAI